MHIWVAGVGESFAPAEWARIQAAPAEPYAVFQQHWACKEAYSKALGIGTQLDFASAGFQLASTGDGWTARRLGAADSNDWPTPGTHNAYKNVFRQEQKQRHTRGALLLSALALQETRYPLERCLSYNRFLTAFAVRPFRAAYFRTMQLITTADE